MSKLFDNEIISNETEEERKIRLIFQNTFNWEIKNENLLNSDDPYTAKRAQITKYVQDHSREKFIYDSNKILNNYLEFIKNEEFDFFTDNPSLLALLFSIISFLKEKDNFTTCNEEIFKNDIFGLKGYDMLKSRNFNILEFNIDIEEIPKEGLEISKEDFQIINKHVLNRAIYFDNSETKKWESTLNYESLNPKIIICAKDKFILKKNGVCLIKCDYLYGAKSVYIKFNIGKCKEKNIYQFFFEQLRNIFAHGRFTYSNSGFHTNRNYFDDSIDYDYSTDYKKMLCQEYFDTRDTTNIQIYDKNRLNLAYNGNNWISISRIISNIINLSILNNAPNSITEFSQIHYSDLGFGTTVDLSEMFKDNFKNKFIKYAVMSYPFDYRKRNINIPQEIIKNKSIDLIALLLLSKFYVNFIYNYDTCERRTFNYNVLNINIEDKSNYIYMIRTSIAHGRYKYDKNGISFYNTDENGNIIFSEYLSYSKFEELINQKEKIFYENMQYNPDNIEINKSYQK